MTHGFPTWPEPPDLPPVRRPGWKVAVALLVLVGVGAGVAWWMQESASASTSAGARTSVALTDTSARAPAGVRVVVRVVNASGVRGLARRATLVLRDFGYDVVDYDSERSLRESTQITVHTGRPEWAERLKHALGIGTITTSADTSRYVDLTVVLGRDWQPPSEPLRP